MKFDIPLLEPNMGQAEADAAMDAVRYNTPCQGPQIEEFESLVAKATKREWCVATSSGTAALHLSLLLLGVRSGTTVHVPSFTFAATANAIISCGANLWFADVDEKTWVAKQAFLSVETLGNETSGLAVVDAACSIGRGKIGGILACLSFNGNKTITTGGGGAIVGDGEVCERELRLLIKHSHTENYNYEGIGYNYRMPNVNAAIGVAQMARLDEFVQKKIDISQRYFSAFYHYSESLPHIEGAIPWLSGYQTDTAAEDIRRLREMGIEAKPFWKPLHLQEPYKDFPRDDLPITEKIWSRIVTLPSSTTLTDAQQSRVIESVLSLHPGEQTQAP